MTALKEALTLLAKAAGEHAAKEFFDGLSTIGVYDTNRDIETVLKHFKV